MDVFNNVLSNDIFNIVKENIRVVLKRSMIKFHTQMPRSASANGVYDFAQNFYDDWHVGFWAGIYYMAYEMFGDKTFLNYADGITEVLQEKTINNTIWKSADEGYIYIPSCVNFFKMHKDYSSMEAICLAADRMVESMLAKDKKSLNLKYSKAGGITNLNLVRLVGVMSKNDEYIRFADKYEKVILENNIFPDGSCVLKVFNPQSQSEKEHINGKSIFRPYALLLHGLALRYTDAKNEMYLSRFQKVIEKYMNIFYDMMINGANDTNSDTFPDTTSICICNCAIMELIKSLDASSPLIEAYLNIFKYNINFVISDYLIGKDKNSQGLINGGLLGLFTGEKIKGSVVMGDYFFMESLMHLNYNYKSCWDINNFFKYIN